MGQSAHIQKLAMSMLYLVYASGVALGLGCADDAVDAGAEDSFRISYDVAPDDTGCIDCDVLDVPDQVDKPDEGSPLVDVSSLEDVGAEETQVWSLSPDQVPNQGALVRAESIAAGVLIACGDNGSVAVYAEDAWSSLGIAEGVDLTACHGASSTALVATGEQGRVWRRAGSAWSNEDLTEESPGLLDVYVESEDSFVVVGVAGTIYHWSAGTWSKNSLADAAAVHAVHGADGSLFATGDELLLSWDGSTWVSDTLPEDPLGTPAANQGFRGRDIWAASPTAVWAVGDRGKVAFRGGDGVWVRQDAKWQATAFRRVVGLDDTHLLAMGDKGLLREFRDGAWIVPAVESPEFQSGTPPQPWPDARKVPAQATLEFVGGSIAGNGQVWLFTGSGQWITFSEQPF